MRLLATKAQSAGDQGLARWELRLSRLGVKGQICLKRIRKVVPSPSCEKTSIVPECNWIIL